MAALTQFNSAEITDNLLIGHIQKKVDGSRYKIFGYHCLPPIGGDKTNSVCAVDCISLSKDKTADYKRNKCYKNNPFVTRPLVLARPLFWSEIAKLPDLGRSGRRCVDWLASHFHGHGLSIPVFGPFGHNGNVAISLSADDSLPSEAEIQILQMICQQSHVSLYNLLQSSTNKSITFSDREREVLEWIVMGKSNSVIADIMGISAHTVNSYIRRIFLKLDATDRVSAAFKAMAVGAIY